MRNAWAFRVDRHRWVPLPGAESWDASRRQQWIERAMVVAGIAAAGYDVPLDAVRARVAALADAARGPESVVFVPVAEPWPVLVHMDTAATAEVASMRDKWHAKGAGARSVEVTPLLDAKLDGAERVARVDVDAQGSVTYSVAFMGTAGDLGTVWHGSTAHPLVAGQLMAMGAEVFATVERRA